MFVFLLVHTPGNTVSFVTRKQNPNIMPYAGEQVLDDLHNDAAWFSYAVMVLSKLAPRTAKAKAGEIRKRLHATIRADNDIQQ